MKKTKIRVEEVGVCDEYEVGNWMKCYPFLKLGYQYAGHRAMYSDTAFFVRAGDDIVGYYMAYNVINTGGEDIIPAYGKKLVLYDFAVAARAYARYGRILMDHMIAYAKSHGFHAIEIPRVPDYLFFFRFLGRHYPLQEGDNACYILIEAPRIRVSQRYLAVYEDDGVGLEDLYFLYDLKFSVQRRSARIRFEDGALLSVDRRSGIITFPPHVRVRGDAVVLNAATRSIVCLICDMHAGHQVEDVLVKYSIREPKRFEMTIRDRLYVNKTLPELRADIAYVRSVRRKGIRYLYPYTVEYNMNENSIGRSLCRIECSAFLKQMRAPAAPTRRLRMRATGHTMRKKEKRGGTA